MFLHGFLYYIFMYFRRIEYTIARIPYGMDKPAVNGITKRLPTAFFTLALLGLIFQIGDADGGWHRVIA